MAQTPAPPSLMTLAPELRNAICERYLLNEIKEVQITNSGAIVNQPGLLAVCRQLRAETLPVFQDLAPKFAQNIVIKVHNFDFSTVIAFLDALDAEQRAAVHKNNSLLLKLSLDEEQVIDVDLAIKGLLQWRAHCEAKAPGHHAGNPRLSEPEVYRIGYHALQQFIDTLEKRLLGAPWADRSPSSMELRVRVPYHEWKGIWSLWNYCAPIGTWLRKAMEACEA
ncbi:hypothetical protein LTR27_008631 [Elasticomyces elasticus]|nr:hypothetical protein LTR27_008631 [Elasticomyces elasticus]